MIEIGSSSCSSQLSGRSGAPEATSCSYGIVRAARVVDADDLERAQVERVELRRERVVDEQRARARVAQDEVDLRPRPGAC